MDYDVIIVGAGITGLTAAIFLKERDPALSILIVEAEDRAGGRVTSSLLSNGVVWNEGANWFHGLYRNDFYQWLRARYDFPPCSEDDARHLKIIWPGESEPHAAYLHAVRVLEDSYHTLCASAPDKHALSIEDVARFSRDEAAVQLAAYMAQDWMAAPSEKDVSAPDYFEEHLGFDGLVPGKGMGQAVRFLQEDAQKRGVDIRYSCAAQKILQKGEIVTSQGVFHALCIIVTVSVGVLHAGFIAFDPAVQAEVERKIEGLAMGNQFKAALPLKEGYLQRLGYQDNTHFYGMTPGSYAYAHIASAGKPVISFFKAGPYSTAFEALDSAAVLGRALEELCATGLFPGLHENIEGDIRCSSWGRNPRTRGSYSYCKPGFTRPDNFRVGQIIFAGEAFLSDPQKSPGQIVGAWYSGRYAADMVFDHKIKGS